ncbi:uncharacterized protein MONBRDRAFT_33129 [Monosiga brevicollis MX1]|uniref:dCMP deaminase n=1 Tax=Monosiga brevicollis TaxID=81824 RepID=A9V3W2_MONBE|nr:uncharacterized protein MONBRDRAFT_33129 [Monosiga brevicollis MX1]EDQ87780.1 predicted protein [Monosiga brevicollis MX1]|eukprot:XP_001747313.1 hypothetical protein [Monosiga brevicollis MX1]
MSSATRDEVQPQREGHGGGGGREDYLPWDDYFMAVAFLSAKRSKDPNTQIGSCIVNAANKIVGIGYNGMPRGCDDDALPWAREGPSVLDTKYPYVCNAEMNAILNKNSASLRGCRMYTAFFPNSESAKLIIQAGITEVLYTVDRYAERPEYQAARRLFALAKVHCRQHTPLCSEITLDFDAVEFQASRQASTASSVPTCDEVDAPSVKPIAAQFAQTTLQSD